VPDYYAKSGCGNTAIHAPNHPTKRERKMQNWKLVVKADGKTMHVRIQAQYGANNVKSLPIKE
jgi:ribosomal protein L28